MKFANVVISLFLRHIWWWAIVAAVIGLGSMSRAQDEPQAPELAQPPSIIKTIQVQGNQRVEANTVASYLLFAPGDPYSCLLYTSPSPRDKRQSRMPSSA